jgi:hypothetical protein
MSRRGNVVALTPSQSLLERCTVERLIAPVVGGGLILWIIWGLIVSVSRGRITLNISVFTWEERKLQFVIAVLVRIVLIGVIARAIWKDALGAG